MRVLDLFNLEGKTALVTGCKRGIGKAMAIGLAEAGADIIGVSASLELTGSDVEKEITGLGRSFKAFQCDFSNRRELYSFIEQVKSEIGHLDILINNAGSILRAPIVEHSDEYWDEIIEINLSAQFLLTREFGKDMITAGRGKIVFTASILTFQGGITVPGYAASKGAIGQLTKALSNEWAGKGLNINAIAPGYVSTDITAELQADTKRNKSIVERIPMGRWGNPNDFKGPVVFLSSPASDYMNGAILVVDGGWMGR